MEDQIVLEFSPELVRTTSPAASQEELQPTGGCCNSGGSCKSAMIEDRDAE